MLWPSLRILLILKLSLVRPDDIYEAQLLNLFTQGISALRKIVTARV